MLIIIMAQQHFVLFLANFGFSMVHLAIKKRFLPLCLWPCHDENSWSKPRLYNDDDFDDCSLPFLSTFWWIFSATHPGQTCESSLGYSLLQCLKNAPFKISLAGLLNDALTAINHEVVSRYQDILHIAESL